jgi:hypothetical protein
MASWEKHEAAITSTKLSFLSFPHVRVSNGTKSILALVDTNK